MKGKGFGRIPIIELKNNTNKETDLHVVKTLIDNYDRSASEFSNDLEDIQQAIITAQFREQFKGEQRRKNIKEGNTGFAKFSKGMENISKGLGKPNNMNIDFGLGPTTTKKTKKGRKQNQNIKLLKIRKCKSFVLLILQGYYFSFAHLLSRLKRSQFFT